MRVVVATVTIPEALRSADHWAARADDLADAAVLQLDQYAARSMSPRSASAYQAGIQKLELGPGHYRIVLNGTMPNMLEQGWHEDGGVDLRTTLLKPGSKGVKTSKAGYLYRSVPFRHGLPGTIGHAGQPMGSQFGAQGHEIGARVAAAAKALRPVRGSGSFVGPRGGAHRLREGLAPLLRPHHATDIFAGMRRGLRGTGYMTWRIISNNPGAADGMSLRSWWHPGIPARHLFPMLAGWIRSNGGRTLGIR